jgi:hypothetical protein
VAREASAELVVPAPGKLEHARVGVEQEHGLVAVELERGPAVVELELVQVEAVRPRGHRRVQRAAALRTKSVIAARRPGLRLLAVEDLAEAEETTREPAAAEVATVWAAAASMAADVAAADAAAADVAAAEAGDKRTIGGEKL